MRNRWWWEWFVRQLDRRRFLLILLAVNFLGSIYGYYWYKNQLAATPVYWLPFVPDSPTASAAFTLVLLLYLINRRSPFWEAFAGVTLFKYGIWAVAMILAGAALSEKPFLESLVWTDWMLMASHLGMALEGVLYSRFFAFGRKEILLVAGWILLNDVLDYGVGIHPWLPLSMAGTEPAVALFTLSLSLISLLLFTWLVFPARPERKEELPLWFKRT
ncbi:DUF1405 domain-containing protein [Kroppenstedtia eburnea]|uniref:Uncharacterized membrane protein YpjA n=1 Tax=Kroppenstedtia eburnea TaxID=714067 RepID=A0A1N7IQC5_9BACL|nr:DUF1405 domain-containing protein [Kroppenstedtia eburnea]QKI82079.1 DUF1405 domain-containing protein [Kroppenstedtia eburnea]SIS39273.1 Uncharacterized membrane protein YpjA [Kroppenstedtia eburnea]